MLLMHTYRKIERPLSHNFFYRKRIILPNSEITSAALLQNGTIISEVESASRQVEKARPVSR